MKVLQCINTLSSGGAEVFATGLAIALKRLGCDVEIFTYSGVIDSKGKQLEIELAKTGIKHTSPKLIKNSSKPVVPLHLARAINTFKPDVCHSHLEQSDFFLYLASRLSRNKICLARTIHSIFLPASLPKYIHKTLADNYSANIACGPAVFEQYPYLGKNKLTINNGVDISSFTRRHDVAEIRRSLGIRNERLLVQVGSFVVRNNTLPKSQDVIVRALKKVKAENYVVAFIGDGERRNEVERLAEEVGVMPKCRFLGKVDNPADYICASDAVLMPSRFEGLSIGCIEAVCLGKPVIASDISAFSPFRKPSSLFVQPENVQQLAEVIDNLIENIDDLKIKAMENQAKYCEEFEINSVASKYIECYQHIMGARKS